MVGLASTNGKDSINKTEKDEPNFEKMTGEDEKGVSSGTDSKEKNYYLDIPTETVGISGAKVMTTP